MLDSVPPSPPPTRPRTLKVVVLLVLAVLIVAGVVFWGINARIQTAAAVKETTQELAIPAVSVIHPKPGAMKNEVVLPGNVMAFTEPQGHRDHTDDHGERGHQHGPKASEAGFESGARGIALVRQMLLGKADDQNAICLLYTSRCV